MNVEIPEEYGGGGPPRPLDGCLIEEEFGWALLGHRHLAHVQRAGRHPVILGGSEEIKKEFLGMLTEEPKLASFCLTEPEAGSDVGSMRTRAVKKGDKYVINGSKVFITNGSHASWYTVYAKTDPDKGTRASPPSSCRATRPASRSMKKEDKLGQRASDTAQIQFEDVEVPARNLLGEENHGFRLAMMTLDRTRPGVAAMAVGIGRAAFEFAADYAKERVQFGVPIAMHQAIQFMIADMATKVEAGRLLTWQSAALLDQGKRNTLAAPRTRSASPRTRRWRSPPTPSRSTAATGSSRSTRSRS